MRETGNNDKDGHDIDGTAKEMSIQINEFFAPYYSKITDALLNDICLVLFKGFAHFKITDKTNKKANAKDILEGCIMQTSSSVDKTNQRLIINKLLKNLIRVEMSMKELRLTYDGDHNSINSKERENREAGKLFMDFMKNKTAHDGGYPHIFPPATIDINGSKITLWGEDARLRQFVEHIEWMKECATDTASMLNNNKKIGKNKDVFAVSLIIPLANAYYSLAGEIPFASFSGSDNTAKGRVVEFISKVLDGLGHSHHDRWIVEQIDSQVSDARNGNPISFYAIPEWVNIETE